MSVYLDQKRTDSLGELHGLIRKHQQRKNYILLTFACFAGALFIVYAQVYTSSNGIFFRPSDDGAIIADHLHGDKHLQFWSVGQRAIDTRALSSGIIARRADLHGLPPIRVTDMTRTNDTREGQPVVAINPLNPDNLVYVSTRFYPMPSLSPVGGCFLAYTFDRGHTWTNLTAEYPLGSAPYCGEPQVFADANGTFYILNNQVFTDLEDNETSHPQLTKSTDGGKTWSVPSVTPLFMQGATKLRVDLTTGKVYANGASSWEYPAAVSVSSDGGDTWAPFNQIPGPINICLDYEIPGLAPVCGFPGRSIAVHDGILASAANGLDGYPEMYVSRDDGVTWTTLPLTDSHGNLVANGTGPMMPVSGVGLPSDPTPWVAADPTKKGRLALMVPREFTLEIYITENAGTNFTGPTVIQTPYAQRPAVDFGPTGLLGVMWRTNSSNILDAYSTVSFDGGLTFPTPLKLTNVSEPVGETGQPGDRASFIALTDKYAYVAWSDGRDDAMLDAILAEVPLELYKNN
ncbi:Sialidase [Xylariales sp. PMI_506]|nr:Sialidase [Xylariales sp. PMI_506]